MHPVPQCPCLVRNYNTQLMKSSPIAKLQESGKFSFCIAVDKIMSYF